MEVCTEGQEPVFGRRGLGEEGSVAMATSNPRDPRSSSPGLVEKGGPGRLSGRLGRARYSPECHSTQGGHKDVLGARGGAQEGRCRRGGARARNVDSRAEERVRAGQDGRRRDTHHVNNTLLRRETEPTTLLAATPRATLLLRLRPIPAAFLPRPFTSQPLDYIPRR